MSEEEIAASDLESSIIDAKQRNEKIKNETEAEVLHVQENIKKLMECYKAFNTKMEAEMRKVGQAFAKLENGKNILNN